MVHVKTILQLEIVSYYQSFTVFCIIRQNMNLSSVNYCAFQGQFECVLNTIEKKWFTELFWSKAKTTERYWSVLKNTQKGPLK